MKRQIIRIDEELCNGCGDCVSGCSEGALQIVDGKAKLVKEDFCDGFGDCIKECPTGALTIEERETAEFDEKGVKKHLLKNFGEEAVKRMEDAQKRHSGKIHHEEEHSMGGGCPGSRMIMREAKKSAPTPSGSAGQGQVIPSELTQWPIQIHLVSPHAPYFKDRELVLMSTCGPIASADTHWRYLRGRSVVVGCPKLDNTEPYAEKLAAIMVESGTPKVIVVRMEVPCCGGLTQILMEAHQMSGRTDVTIEEHTLGLDGSLKATKVLISPEASAEQKSL